MLDKEPGDLISRYYVMKSSIIAHNQSFITVWWHQLCNMYLVNGDIDHAKLKRSIVMRSFWENTPQYLHHEHLDMA